MKFLTQSKMIRAAVLTIFSLGLITACDDNLVEKPEQDDTVVGFTTVDLDANKVIVRGEESLLGNVIADAMMKHAEDNGFDIDGAMANGGGIRFNSDNHPNGIFPAGNLTRDDINEILPFGNSGVIVTMTGAELISTLERGVHGLPIPEGDSGSGSFLQVSSTIQMEVSLQNQAQLLNELTDPVTIDTEGTRVTFLRIKGEVVDMNATYDIMVPDFIAGGGDGFVTLGSISDGNKNDLGVNLAQALEAYVAANSPISPVIESRIVVFD